MVTSEGGKSMKMIPQGRWLAASTGAWVATWALMASATTAQQPEAPAAKPRASDGWRPKARQGTATDDGAKPEAEAAATKNAPAAAAPKSDAPTGAKAPPATKPDPASKPADAAKPANAGKGTSQPERRAVPSGAGNRSLAAEKASIDGVTTKTSIDEILARTLPLRSDRAGDWLAGSEPLHQCGEPRWIEPCIPLPPCHPSHPPHPYDLVGVAGDPTCGPIYRGPCCPRTGTHDDGPLPRLHWVNDRLFDAFYQTK
jgi:hypothetical protein